MAAKLKGKAFDAVIDMVAFKRDDVVNIHEVMAGNVGRYVFISSVAVYYGQGVTPSPFSTYLGDDNEPVLKLVPEPGTLTLLTLGSVGLLVGGFVRRRRRQA